MPLTVAQRTRIFDDDHGVRAGLTNTDIRGAGYGLCTAGPSVAGGQAWLRTGPPAGWCNQLYNTAAFMVQARAAWALYLHDAGSPSLTEYYTVPRGGRGNGRTLPKISAVNSSAQIIDRLNLAGQTELAVYNWLLAHI
jgi:hypothetical protein